MHNKQGLGTSSGIANICMLQILGMSVKTLAAPWPVSTLKPRTCNMRHRTRGRHPLHASAGHGERASPCNRQQRTCMHPVSPSASTHLWVFVVQFLKAAVLFLGV